MAMLSVFPLKGAVQLLSVLCVASAVLLMINSRDQLSRSPRIEALGLPIPLSEDISIDPPAVTILRDTRLPRQTTRSAAMDFASPVSAAPVTVLQKHRLHKAMMRSDELDASTVYPHHLAGGFQTLGMADIKPTETILDEAESGPSTVTNEVTNEASNIEATPTVTSEATTTETPEDDTAPVFDKDNCVSWLCQRHPQVTDNSAALWNWKEKGEHTLATRTRVDKCVALVVDALATEANERKKTSDYDYMGGTAALMTSVSDYFSSFSSSDECTENSVTTFVTETFTWLLQKGQDELAKEVQEACATSTAETRTDAIAAATEAYLKKQKEEATAAQEQAQAANTTSTNELDAALDAKVESALSKAQSTGTGTYTDAISAGLKYICELFYSPNASAGLTEDEKAKLEDEKNLLATTLETTADMSTEATMKEALVSAIKNTVSKERIAAAIKSKIAAAVAAKTLSTKTTTFSWRDETACQFGGTLREEDDAESDRPEKQTLDLKDLPAAKDLVTIADERENPNSEAFEPVEPAGPACSGLHVIPGSAFLASGFDPMAKVGCQFDECRTKRIFRYSHDTCMTVHTPGGTFAVPDQISVLNKYETTASTNVYESAKDYELDIASKSGMTAEFRISSVGAGLSFGMNKKGASESHLAVRKVDVSLYYMKLEKNGLGLEPEFYRDASFLPTQFNADPHRFLRFLRKWGRYTIRAANYGGTLEMFLKFKGASKASNYGAAAELKFDTVFSGVNVGLESSTSVSHDSGEQMANSEISIQANGGDPTIAASITDVVPGAHQTATFRSDFVNWLQSIPNFPRLVNNVPQLDRVSKALPTHTPGLECDLTKPGCWNRRKLDALRWRMRSRSLDQAINIMATHPEGAMNADKQQCSADGFVWRDYNRFALGDCVSFTSMTSGDIELKLSDSIFADAGNDIVVHIGLKFSSITYVERGVEKEVWKSDDATVRATGSSDLAGRFWFCVAKDEEKGGTALTYGVRDSQVTARNIDFELRPRYFALNCPGQGRLRNIDIIKAADFFKTMSTENNMNIGSASEWSASQHDSSVEFIIRSGASSACWTVLGNRVVLRFSTDCAYMHNDYLWRKRGNGALRHVGSELCVQKPATFETGYDLLVGEDCDFPFDFDNTAPSNDDAHFWAGSQYFNLLIHGDSDDANHTMCVRPQDDVVEDQEPLEFSYTCGSSASTNWLPCRTDAPCNDNRAQLVSTSHATTCANGDQKMPAMENFNPSCPAHSAIQAMLFSATGCDAKRMKVSYECASHYELLSTETTKTTKCVKIQHLDMLTQLGFQCEAGHAVSAWHISQKLDKCKDEKDAWAVEYTCVAGQLLSTAPEKSACVYLKWKEANQLQGVALRCPNDEVMTGLEWKQGECEQGSRQAITNCAKLILPEGQFNTFKDADASLTTAEQASECLPILYSPLGGLAVDPLKEATCPLDTAYTGFKFDTSDCNVRLPTATISEDPPDQPSLQGTCVDLKNGDQLPELVPSASDVPKFAAMQGLQFVRYKDATAGCANPNEVKVNFYYTEWEMSIVAPPDKNEVYYSECVKFRMKAGHIKPNGKKEEWNLWNHNFKRNNWKEELDTWRMVLALQNPKLEVECPDGEVMSYWRPETCTVGSGDDAAGGLKIEYRCKSASTDASDVRTISSPFFPFHEDAKKYDSNQWADDGTFWRPIRDLDEVGTLKCPKQYAVSKIGMRVKPDNTHKVKFECNDCKDSPTHKIIPETEFFVDCIKLKPPLAGVRFTANCASSGLQLVGSDGPEQSTQCHPVGGTVEQVAKFAVTCPYEMALTSWHFSKDDCKDSEAKVLFSCRKADLAEVTAEESGCYVLEGQPFSSLTELSPQCGENELMTGFSFEGGHEATCGNSAYRAVASCAKLRRLTV